MMKLVFLISAWLICKVQCSLDSQNHTEEDVEQILERLSDNILTSLTDSLRTSLSTYRQKRHLVENLSLKDDSGVYRLKGLKPVAKLCYPAVQTLFIQVSNTTYIVCVSAQTDDPAELIIGTYEGHEWFPFYRRFINNHENAVAFHSNNYFYVLFADREKESGTDLVKIDLTTKEEEKPFYSPTSNHPTRIAVWDMKPMGTYNLAIANSNENYDASDLTSKVVVFYWKDAYFNQYSEFSAFDVRDIEPFFIHDAAYMAIANFRRGKDKNEVDSEILRYDPENAWVSHQKIRTYGAVDWEFFTLGTSLGQEFFLALASQGIGGKKDRSIIYKFVNDKFVPIQCLQTTMATSISSYSRGDAFVLAIANEYDAVHLYQYDGWRFVKSGVQYTTGAMAYGVKHLQLYEEIKNSKSSLILSVSNPVSYEKSVFEVELVHENSMGQWHKRSTDWCLNTLPKLENADIDKLIGSFDDVIFTDQESVTIDGDVVFEGGFVTENLETPKLTENYTQKVFDNNLLNKLAYLQERLQIVKQKLEGFSGVLKNALKIDGNQTISSSLEFQDAEFDCREHSCQFENIYTLVLNQESVSDWKNQLVFLDTEQFINGTLWANEIKASSIHVQGLIDGVHSQTLVTKSGDHTIEGRKEFHNFIFAKDLKVSGKVDGVIVSPANVLITTGRQTLQGEISFDDLETTWLYASYVNGKNLSHFYSDMVFTNKPQTITGLKTFSDVTIDDLIMIPGSKINGVDLVDLWENAMWINGTQEIKAEITFSDVMFKSLKVSGGINGVQIPGRRVVDITENAVITSPQVFSNSTQFGHLEIRGSLNEVPLVQAPDGSKQLDIMLKTGHQIVTGRKTFHTIHLGDNSEVWGTVDGVDLSEFKASVLRSDSTVSSNGTFYFNNLVIKGPLTVEGRVSGVKIEDIYSRALKLNEANISEMLFHDLVYVTDLQSNNINGINVRTDLVLKKQPQTLTGQFNFTEIEIEENARILGLVNGNNFTFLNQILLRIGDQHIKKKVFKRNIKIKNLTVQGSINGVPVSDIVTVKGGQINGTRILNNVTFSKINAKNVELTGRVNNIDLNEMIKNTMTSDGNEVVTGEKNIEGTIYVLNGSDFSTSNLNNIDIGTLFKDAVLVDLPQTITGEKIFKENVVFNNLTFLGTINGVSDWEIKDWMLTDVPQTVDSDVQFQSGFSAKDLIVNAVNGLDLKQLETDIVKVNEETEIKGSVIFESAVSENNINLLGRIQGVHLSQEAVLRDHVVVESDKTFTQDLVFEGDISVDGEVDGIDVNDLCSKTFLRNQDVNISKIVIKGNVFLLDDVAVGGSLAGINISLFKDLAVASSEPEIKFSGVKRFTNLTLSGPVLLKGKFGGVDLGYLNAYYMSLTRDQEIPAAMTFDELSFKGTLSVNNLDTANNEINGINVHKLDNTILKTYGTQTVTAPYNIDEVHFASDVFVKEKVNGCKLPEGVMRRNHTNFIQSPKIFQQAVVVRGDLEMSDGRTIQDVDVSDWYQKSVLRRGQFHIRGTKTFNNLELNDIIVEGMMDGLKISEKDLLMTYGDQVVTKRKIIQGGVTIEGSLTVNGAINNVNLTQLSLETLQRDRDNTITGSKYFAKPLTIVSLEAPSVSGVDIAKVKEKLDSSINLSTLENQIGELEKVVKHMQNAFENQAVLFQYYELFDKFDIPSVYNSLYVSGPDCGELLMLLENSGSSEYCSTLKIFGYDRQSSRFIPTRQELRTSYAVSAESLVLNGTTNLFVANRGHCCSCLGNSSSGSASIDIYSWNISQFSKVQSLAIHEPTSMVVFHDKGLACIVVLEAIASRVFCSSKRNYVFTEVQSLSTTGGQQATLLKSQGRIILAIAAEDNSYARQNYVEGQSSIDIYLWSSTEEKFVYTKQILRSTSSQSIVLMNYHDERSESVFLVVAEGKIRKIYNEPKLLVYRLKESSDTFEEYQEIKDNGILEWVTLSSGELIFFAVDPHEGHINVYQYKGASGFVKIDTVKSLGVKKVCAFTRSDPEDWLNHYLLLSGSDCKPQKTRNEYYAKILKSKVKGERPKKVIY